MKSSFQILTITTALVVLTIQRTAAIQARVEVLQAGTNFAYTVFNDEAAGSSLQLDAFHLRVRAPIDVLSSPAGWVFETDGFTYIDWVCTNEVPPYPQDIAPGGSLAGFALRTTVGGTDTNTFALTTWDHGNDNSGPVFEGTIATPAIVGFNASLTYPFYSTTNTFHFDLKGIPSFSYSVQSSSNLTDWTSMLTNTAPFSFYETNKTAMRFYRPLFVPDSNSWPVLAD